MPDPAPTADDPAAAESDEPQIVQSLYISSRAAKAADRAEYEADEALASACSVAIQASLKLPENLVGDAARDAAFYASRAVSAANIARKAYVDTSEAHMTAHEAHMAALQAGMVARESQFPDSSDVHAKGRDADDARAAVDRAAKYWEGARKAARAAVEIALAAVVAAQGDGAAR